MKKSMFVSERTGFDEGPVRGSISIYPKLLKFFSILGLHLEITREISSNVPEFNDKFSNSDHHLTSSSNPVYL
jgi:hypothetical protein